jgi:predicted glycoside hydrolase/deacetylase ChbG (UPF0249 family)
MQEGQRATAIVSADDLGLSCGITDGILDAIDNGFLTSTSVIANGAAFDYAIDEYRKREGLMLAVHLNLCEGRALTPRDEIALLVDENGNLCRSFASLLLGTARASRGERQDLKQQLKTEMRAQILRVGERMGMESGFRVDSHQHYHMIPIVFDALMELHEEFEFSYVRNLAEPFFLLDGWSVSARDHLGLNLIKHLLLKSLAARAGRRLEGMNIPHCDRFVGVLFSGHMTNRVVRSAIDHIRATASHDAAVELLLHPGQARVGEESLWQDRPELASYYFSDARAEERNTLKSSEFRSVLKSDSPNH